MKKRSVVEEIDRFHDVWKGGHLVEFLRDIMPLVELYDVDEGDDWVEAQVGAEDVDMVRIIRTTYLISRIADRHAGILARIKCEYRDLWKRIENFEKKKEI